MERAGISEVRFSLIVFHYVTRLEEKFSNVCVQIVTYLLSISEARVIQRMLLPGSAVAPTDWLLKLRST